MNMRGKTAVKRAFGCAFQGILDAAREQRSFRVMLVCMLAVVLAGLACGLSAGEWAAVLLCCGVTLALELVNTALEAAVNLATREQSELARRAKDAAAGAALVFAAISAAVGLIIFVPYIIRTFTQ
jgi:undecaprenol kinase